MRVSNKYAQDEAALKYHVKKCAFVEKSGNIKRQESPCVASGKKLPLF
jgi:hypothetical protein